MSTTIVGADGLRAEMAEQLRRVSTTGPVAVVCWELRGSDRIDVIGLRDAVLTGLRATRHVLPGDRPQRLVHVVRTHHDAPTARALHGFVAAFTKSLAREMARTGTTVNAVGVSGEDHDSAGVGPLVAFLIGPGSSWITGQALGVTGVTLADPAPSGPAAIPDGSVALVSGGAGAIGSAISRSLHAAGWHVAVGYVHEGSAAALSRELDPTGRTSTALAFDVTDHDQLDTALATLGPDARGLVLCGGYSRTGMFADSDEDDWAPALAINLLGPTVAAQLMASRTRECVIVGIGSESSKAGDAGRAVYAGAKAGLAALLAGMNEPDGGVRALTVAPGPIDTPMLWQTHATPEEAEEGIAKLRRLIPLRRLGTPEDVGTAVALAMGTDGRALGGEVLSVGGGITMH